jgi:hypothetical protein
MGADEKPNASESELQMVANLLTKQMSEGFEGVTNQLDRFEDEIRPIVRAHGEMLAVLSSQGRPVTQVSPRRSSLVTATLTGSGLAALGKGLSLAWQYFVGKHS